MGRFDRLGAVEYCGMPLVGVTADETVEILKSQPRGPQVKRTGLARLPVGYVVVLTVPRCIPAVLFHDFCHGATTLGHDRVVAGIAGAELGNDTRSACVVIAPGYECRPCWRAKCRRVKHVVPQAATGQLVESW